MNRAGLVIACLPLLACQVVLDVKGQQCRTDQDCVGLFGRDYVCNAERICIDEADAPDEMPDAGMPSERPMEWACLDEPPRMLVPEVGRTVTLRFVVTDFVNLTVPEGLVAKACENRDIPCAMPVIPPVHPGTDGFLEFKNLPHAWRGYILIGAEGYVDSLVYSNRAYAEDEMTEGPTILTPATLNEIAMGGNEQIDMTKGIAIITVYDCLGNAAPGIRLEQADENADEPAFYFEGTLPDRERTTTTISTDLTRSHARLAAGGFSHIDPGYVTMRAILDETDEEIGRVTVQIREFNMTFAEIHAGY